MTLRATLPHGILDGMLRECRLPVWIDELTRDEPKAARRHDEDKDGKYE
jgi:hypothetical protein